MALRLPARPPACLRVCSLSEHVTDDDAKLSAPEIHSYLSRVMYNRRNKQNPLWNKLLVAGACMVAWGGGRRAASDDGRWQWQRHTPRGCWRHAPACCLHLHGRHHRGCHVVVSRGVVWCAGHKDGKSFLGYVDLIGTCFTDNYIATGYGLHLALPLIRDRWRADMTEGEARALLEDCMRVLWYRDCRALNKLTLAKVRWSRRGTGQGRAGRERGRGG